MSLCRVTRKVLFSLMMMFYVSWVSDGGFGALWSGGREGERYIG